MVLKRQPGALIHKRKRLDYLNMVPHKCRYWVLPIDKLVTGSSDESGKWVHAMDGVLAKVE
jgi:hypothetical protein